MRVSVEERRAFLKTVGGACLAGLAASASALAQPAKAKVSGGPRGSEFVFARVRYTSGDWDFNPKVAANVLNSLVEYTTVPVYGQEVVISADSTELFAFPFIFMTCLLYTSPSPRDGLLSRMPSSA